MEKSYRIHTNISQDTLLQVNMQQDFDFLEVLSLKLRQKDAYRIHSSNYGVIVGRVLANDAFGIPNAKLSIFIERDDNDSSEIENIYPYSEVTTKDKSGRRYNLLPDYSDDDCYRIVGTFPSKRLMLDDDIQLEVYEKYWKYTTVTNNAGDYMIFGVPTGSVTVHVDIDLSDIGVLSQKPRDFEYKGYNLTMFDSPSQFKESTNLENLAQLFSQNRSVFVYPFWGDADNGVAAITRADIQIQYKFEPTCVFMGSIVSDNEGHAIGHKCAPDVENGMNNQLIGGSGTIEMIRKTTDGFVEEYQIKGNQLIDENGVWCYQIPMNLDYIGTDEYGNIVPTDNPNKGIPTRTQVRFRISKNETSDEGFSRHTAKYLVPMNPDISEDSIIPKIPYNGSEIEKMYNFGSSTPISCFRDLYWNNVYSVKNYIPKTQVAHRPYSANYSALKGSNLAEDQNPIPFNKLKIDLPFLFIIICLLFTIVMYIVYFINYVIICLIDQIIEIINKISGVEIFGFRPFRSIIPKINYIPCMHLDAGMSEGNWAYFPGCWCKGGFDAGECPKEMGSNCNKSRDKEDLIDKVQRNLGLEFKIVKLDLYQDWINGCLYMPLWYWRKRKKKSFLFGLITSKAKSEYCSEQPNKFYKRLKTFVTCNIRYKDISFQTSNNRDYMPDNEKKWHKNRSGRIFYRRGLIKPVENRDGLTAYYYTALAATTDNTNPNLEMARRKKDFNAIRLFATDIILLGNLDPKNIYGIPQFFTCLPSTTANIPPMATIEEVDNPNEDEEIPDKDFNDETADSGTTITTGMDWNHNGHKLSPRFQTGLFMDLACTYVNTRPKSCINVERLSELGVTLDMNYNMAYHENGNDVQYGEISADGFITKLELDDMENRAMFATMNHIGFIPQEYQDSFEGYYDTQVYDKNTNYLIPKFKYIYPVDFDGRMQLPMNLYKNGFEQAMFDDRDESYITFRMGAEKDYHKEKNSELRIRHFYHTNYGTNKAYYMPLYNNSYYFYFGVNKGKTAIDKFNEMFYANCVRNKKTPFTLDISSQGRSYCPEAYDGNSITSYTCGDGETIQRYVDGSNKNNAYGYIRVTCDDIRQPYSYTLYDAKNLVVISETGMTLDDFVIGGTINDDGDVVLNVSGEVRYHTSGCDVILPNGLTNQEYILEVVDADGRKLSEKVKLDVPKISGDFVGTKLGTKFYNSATTRIDYICHDDNSFYGKIDMNEFTVDGYTCEITNVEYLGYDNEYMSGNTVVQDDTKGKYVFCVSGSSQDISDKVVAYLELGVFNSSEENLVRNCLCDDNTSNKESYEAPWNTSQVLPNDWEINLITVAQGKEEPVKMYISGATVNGVDYNYFLGLNNGVVTFYLYQPNQYMVRIIQGCTACTNPILENSTTEIINIRNGEPFLTTLNDMPTKFMLGTANDTSASSIANNSFFYKNSVVTDEVDFNIKGWYGLHEEDSYSFSKRNESKTYNYNQNMWEDYIDYINDDVATPESKREILKFKFNTMFSLSEGAYITNDSSCRFMFEATGGVSPILYRSVLPTYSDYEKMKTQYVIDDYFMSECPIAFPNIVSENYSLPEKNGLESKKSGYTASNFVPERPHFNKYYGNDTDEGERNINKWKRVGNYFAAFTRDGSYISKDKIDGINIKIERSPSFASISPIDNTRQPKKKGEEVYGTIDGNFTLAHTLGTQQLNGDIERKTLPYLRGMYVDRRFDYDLVVMAPVTLSSFNLYPNQGYDVDRERVWRGGRISGWTYNGIEMSYDENYNVISASTVSEEYDGDIVYTSATFNKRLEYTYKYDCADKCLTCGYQEQDMHKNGDGSCPKCGGDNILVFHGEIGDCKVVKTIPNGEGGEIRFYEMDVHKKDEKNFNDGAPTKIVGKVKTPPNEEYYTYDDAVTYYHKWKGEWKCDWKVKEPKWGKWNSIEYTYVSGEDSDKKPIYTTNIFGFASLYDEKTDGGDLCNVPLFKEFYSSSIANFDIRNFYWSLFNYDRLGHYTTENEPNQQFNGYGQDSIKSAANPFYVYRYPYDRANDPNWYNGDFNRDDVVQNTDTTNGRVTQCIGFVPYPTKRFIDIGNLPQLQSYNYNTKSCSYNMEAFEDNDGNIQAITDEGEETDITFDWVSPITILPKDENSEDYANITYKPRGCGSGSFNSYVKFTVSADTRASISFRFNKYSCNDFNVYTKAPRLIQVLPYIKDKDIDGIGYYKTANEYSEFDGLYGDGKTLDEAISSITVDNGEFGHNSIIDLIFGEVDTFCPENVKIEINENKKFKTKYGLKVEGRFFKKNNEWLDSNEDDFEAIIFNKSLNKLYNSTTEAYPTVFAILVDREYRYIDNDNLVRHIRSIETSELFDCRDLYMRMVTEMKAWKMNEQTGEREVVSEVESYVEMKKYDASQQPTTGDDSTYVYEQHLMFELKFKDEGTPEKWQNKAFADYETMSYMFRFINRYGDEYDIQGTPSMFTQSGGTTAETTVEYQLLYLGAVWQPNMGIVGDKQWTGTDMKDSFSCELYGKTISGFVYKLCNFKVSLCCNNGGQENPSGSGCGDIDTIKDSMAIDTKYKTHTRIMTSSINCGCST